MHAEDRKFIARAAKRMGLDVEYVQPRIATVRDDRIVALNWVAAPDATLDLAPLDALESVRLVSAPKLASLTLGRLPKLERLEVRDTAIAALDISACPALTELVVDRNRLTKLPTLPPALRRLECSSNAIATLTLELPQLERLVVSSCALEALELTRVPNLRELECAFNRIAVLDLRPLRALGIVWCQDNGATVHLPDAAPLTKAALGKNTLPSFTAGAYPLLQTLFVNATGLSALPLANPKLVHLDCSDNRILALSLDGAPALRILDAHGNPLAQLNTTPAPKLRQLSVDDAVPVAATPLQTHTLPLLRARAGLAKPTKTIAKMDTYQLHAFVESYNWDDGPKALQQVIAHPKCQLATALLVYWQSEPDEPAEKPWAKLLQSIEQGVKTKRFAKGDLPFDAAELDKLSRRLSG